MTKLPQGAWQMVIQKGKVLVDPEFVNHGVDRLKNERKGSLVWQIDVAKERMLRLRWAQKELGREIGKSTQKLNALVGQALETADE